MELSSGVNPEEVRDTELTFLEQAQKELEDKAKELEQQYQEVILRQNRLKNADATGNVPEQSSQPVRSGLAQIVQPTITEPSSSASVSQPITRSIPPVEKGSNPSSEIKTDTIASKERPSVPVLSQDVNSTNPPSEEYQLIGVFQVMMLNWPTTWDSSQVEARCQQQKKCGNAKALSCICTKCGRRCYTKANTDILAADSPDWVTGEGWYAICECGQLEQWTWRHTMKNLMIMEKNLLNTGPVKNPVVKSPTVSSRPRASNFDDLSVTDFPLSVGPLHDTDQVILTTTEPEIRRVISQISELGINSMTTNQISFALTQLQRMARENIKLKSKNEYKTDYLTWLDQNGPSYKTMRDKHAVWASQKLILAQIKRSRIEKVLEAKIDINLAPMDHLLCLRAKCPRLIT